MGVDAGEHDRVDRLRGDQPLEICAEEGAVAFLDDFRIVRPPCELGHDVAAGRAAEGDVLR